MDTSTFIEIVNRARRVEDIKWHADVPARLLNGLCTITVGNPDLGDARNVATPVIPEFADFVDPENRVGIRARGWRELFVLFLIDGWISPTSEVRSWLGNMMTEYARGLSPCK
jgi:hypothetical protein